MKNNNVVIIGAGLGGLECGYMLAKCGMRVTVLERETQLGGCLQTFHRGYATFDTGFHYVGGLGEGEALNRLFTYFDLMGLPWKQLDTDCFDEVIVDDKSYAFANGHKRFVDTLAEHFPHEREGLKGYADFLRQVGDHIFDSLQTGDGETFSQSLFERGGGMEPPARGKTRYGLCDLQGDKDPSVPEAGQPTSARTGRRHRPYLHQLATELSQLHRQCRRMRLRHPQGLQQSDGYRIDPTYPLVGPAADRTEPEPTRHIGREHDDLVHLCRSGRQRESNGRN